MGNTVSGLHQIWPDDLTSTGAALVSLAVLAAFAALTPDRPPSLYPEHAQVN